MDCKNLDQCIKYESKKIITSFRNHITAHFVSMLNRLINIECDIEGTIKWIGRPLVAKQPERVTSFTTQIR